MCIRDRYQRRVREAARPNMKFVLLLTVAFNIQLAHSHGYMLIPAPRNLIPGATTTPQGANTGGVCGTVDGVTNFNDPQWRSNGGTYSAGQTIEVEAVLTAHHQGHFEFRVCNNPSALSQTCFDQHLLERTEASSTPSPKDPNFPGRWYVPPPNTGGQSGRYTMEVKLPAGLTCEHCVLQWTYITGNSCSGKGYVDYFAATEAAGTTTGNWHGWIGNNNAGTCGGREESWAVGGNPEKFWACSDIKIVGSGDPATSAPTSSVTTPPTGTAAPTSSVTVAPTTSVTSAPSSAGTQPPPSPPVSCASAGCDACVSIPGNNQAANDEHCRPCASGQTWWPCATQGLCTCASGGTPTAPPTDAPTKTPTGAPTKTPTEPSTEPPTEPFHNCGSNCGHCASLPGNCANATDAHCAPCATGQHWWPCNVRGLCGCDGNLELAEVLSFSDN
eukprot:TRINITY_DN3961_c0_g1_i6.p1 TRINITY_DN3961_c0_g1~~TRINITY_DN3961_c0_g1_i6.p1  ORF type:complete len:444 (-),score=105.97 TRINITY_DN3961_c0_g1_i6:75-1406(-)